MKTRDYDPRNIILTQRRFFGFILDGLLAGLDTFQNMVHLVGELVCLARLDAANLVSPCDLKHFTSFRARATWTGSEGIE